MAVYNKHKDYLTNFAEPGLIHGDVNQTNVFAVEDGAKHKYDLWVVVKLIIIGSQGS